MIGIGTWPLRGAECAAQIRTAIESGYRLIDTAENYRNEDGVGQGIRDSGIDRAEVFVTTKFNREWHSVDGVRQAYQASLKRLGLDYLDLLLVHWPNPDQDRYVEAVQGLNALLESGELRAIGVSNYKPAHLQRVLDETGIVPDVNQIQLSPYSTRADSRAFNQTHGIVTESCSPIGASSDELAQRSGDHRDRGGVREVGHSGGAALARPARAGGHPEVGRSRPDRGEHRHLRLRAQRPTRSTGSALSTGARPRSPTRTSSGTDPGQPVIGSAGLSPVRVAPTLAITTQAIADHCTGLRNSASRIIAASAATAGSRLIKMLNTRGAIRRSEISSRLYGMTELSRPTATPSSRTLGSSS